MTVSWENAFLGRGKAFFCCGFLLSFLAVRAQDLPSPPNTNKLLFSVQNSSATGVQDLKLEEFSLLDNGSAAKITTLESAQSVPIRLAVLLYSNGATFKTQQQAAIQLLGKLRPQLDQAFVLTQAATNNSSAWPDESQARAWPTEQVVWNSNPSDIIEFVRKLQWDSALIRTPEIAQKMLALDPEKQFRRIVISFLDPRNQAMVEWGDAPYRELEAAQMKEIMEYQREGAVVYTVAIYISAAGSTAGTMSGMRAQYLANKAGEAKIERLATMTGGRYFPILNDVKSYVAQIQADFQNQFIASFIPQVAVRSGVAHKIKLHTSRKDLKIRSQAQCCW